jgi:uncharacterized membrane protein
LIAREGVVSAAGIAVKRRVWRAGALGRWEWALLALVIVPALAFIAAPWSLQDKALAALHGLCAQQPTHSLYFGGARLPYEARMTGIYGGFAVTVAWLLARGRWRAGGAPPVGVLLALGAGVLLMGLDGLNSTLLDMRLWHAYAPRNELRLATGLLTGAGLGVFVWLLLGQVAFAPTAQRRVRVLRGYRDLAALLATLALSGALIDMRWAPLWAPLTCLLLLATVVSLAGLLLAFVLLLGRRECRARLARELAGPACVALLAAYALIGCSAGGRFLLEAIAGVPAARGG